MMRSSDASERVFTQPEPVTVAVLLAGGESRRMGSDKRFLRLEGRTLLARNLDFLQSLFDTVVVSVRAGQALPPDLTPAAKLITDRSTGSPLAGIATALQRFAQPVFVLAADMAAPQESAVRQVLEAFVDVDVALPIVDEKYEPLHAVYGPRCLAPMSRLLERGQHRILDFFPEVRVVTVPFATAIPFLNVNTPSDFERARAIVEGTGRRRGAGEVTDAELGRGQVPETTPESRETRAGEPQQPPPASPSNSSPPHQPALVAIVGKSDSGKTTLIEALLPELKRLGLRVGTVKHDVHGFEMDTPGKDSWRHGQAGADAYVVASPHKLAYIAKLTGELPLVEIARRFFADFDLVLAEGYKAQAPHRIEIFRLAAGYAEPLCRPDESLALITDAPVEHERRFALGDEAGLARFIAQRLDQLRRY